MKDNRLLFKERLREIMDPYQGGSDATWLSLFTDVFILFCILISCALIPLEYLYPAYETLLMRMEFFFVTIFSIEYLLRWYASPSRRKYPFTFYAVIDLAAILPSLLMLSSKFLLLRAIRGIRLLRLLRLMRLIQFFHYRFAIYRGYIQFRTSFDTFADRYRLRQLSQLFFWALIAWIAGSNILYVTESFIVQNQGPFSGYWISYWNIIIVLISGIEDKEPLSLIGKIEITLFLITGIIVVGMLTGEIVSILVRRMQRLGKVSVKPPGSSPIEHILILGSNAHLDNIVCQLYSALKGRYFFLLVSPDAEELKVTDKSIYKRVMAYSGNPIQHNVLEDVNVDQALRVIVLSSEDGLSPQSRDNQALMTTLAVTSRKKGIPMVVELKTLDSLTYVQELEGIDFVVSRHYVERLACQAVLNPGVTAIYDELMNFTEYDSEFYTIPVPEDLIGQTFKDAQLFFLDNDPETVTPVGIDRSPHELPNTHFWINPIDGTNGFRDESSVLNSEDRLIVIAYERPSFATIEREKLWSGKVLFRH